MAKNPVQFQKRLSMRGFPDRYGTEVQCAEALFAWRWPPGLVCPECGHADGYGRMQTRGLLPCRHCRHQASITAGTVLAH